MMFYITSWIVAPELVDYGRIDLEDSLPIRAPPSIIKFNNFRRKEDPSS